MLCLIWPPHSHGLSGSSIRTDKPLMKHSKLHRLRVISLSLAGLGIGLIFFGIILPTCRIFYSFDHLERNARKVITPAALQAWATNLLAHPPATDTPKVSELGTNFPRQLLGLYHTPPYISIRHPSSNAPGSVFLMWGGGMIGHCGFEIGASNFLGFRGEQWQGYAGVNFWSDQKK